MTLDPGGAATNPERSHEDATAPSTRSSPDSRDPSPAHATSAVPGTSMCSASPTTRRSHDHESRAQ